MMNAKKCLLVLGWAVLALASTGGQAFAGEVAIIVNSDNAAATSSVDDLRKAYLDDQLWSNGEKVKRFFEGANPGLRNAMCDKFLMRACPQVERHFAEVGYQKGLTPEKAGDNAGAVIQMVKTFKGGIGIVEKSAVTDGSVKVAASIPY